MPIIKTAGVFARAIDWLFFYAVRLIAVINFVFLSIMSTAFIYSILTEIPSLYQTGVYAPFEYFGLGGWLIVLLIGLIQLVLVVKGTCRGYKAAAMLLLLTGLFWGVASATVISAKSSAISFAAPYMYGAWAVVVCLAGIKMLLLSRQLGDRRNGSK